jgi:general nucleoside transport system permease protein
MTPSPVRPSWQLPAAIAAALGVGFAITALVSAEPWRAFLALLTGALPDIRFTDAEGWQVRRLVRFGSVIEDAITLTFLGLAIAIPFRARQFSLGADGQMFLAALAAVAVSLAIGGPAYLVLPAAFAAALLTGFAWGLVPGWLKARYGASEIVTTLMLNLIAVQLYRLVITQWMRDPHAGFLVTPVLSDAAILPNLLARTNVSAMLYLVPFAVAGAWALLMRTTVGYEIRTVGQAPAFARHAGMPVERAMVLSMALGGAFAALAGVHVSNALLKRLPVDLTPGLGFEGLVVALLARNEPRAIPMAAFLYAYLRAGAQAMERTTDVSRELVLVIEAFIILFVVSERLLPRWQVAGWLRRAARALRLSAREVQ